MRIPPYVFVLNCITGWLVYAQQEKPPSYCSNIRVIHSIYNKYTKYILIHWLYRNSPTT